MHAWQNLQAAEKKYFNSSDSTVFIINKNRIGKGITHFSFFNEENKPVCERLVYVKPPVAVGPTISSDKQVYARRQPIDPTIDGFELNPKLTVIDYNGLQLQMRTETLLPVLQRSR